MPPSHLHRHAPPEVLSAIRRDLADRREWQGRLVVLAFAGLAGGAVVAFTWLCERASGLFTALYTAHPLAPLLLTPLLCAAIVALTRRFAAGASGSGIPQVIAALDPAVPSRSRGLFVSLRLALAKMGLTALGLLGGLPIGREGPSVQIAAGVMLHARRWLPPGASIRPHGLLVAGGAAGIAAAFNAPLAGVMFAIEELTPRMEQRSSGLVVAAIVLAGLVAVSAFGNSAYFGVIHAAPLDWTFLGPAALVVGVSGLVGGVFSRLLHTSLSGTGTDPASRWRRRQPVLFAAACGLVVAAVGVASGGASFGAGYHYTRELVAGQATLPLLYVTLRLVATWIALWSGVPGGLFAPSLAIGAGLGHDVALLCGSAGQSPALIALGMAGFLAAITQAPITAFIIVMEMVDGHALVLSLMAAALLSSLIARWIAQPLYPALAAGQLARLEPAKP
ncbi:MULTISPECIES: chloride channel protein [Ramlibacter]|uniref:Chloride channel protein n=1 Tax=Ramlibacter aquaticus TaxID=2780094 RepID=A0ABR9SF09_9BURK|nr:MULTISPECIES: chloride channel protein [Ramlibacter]MBE7940322.1 chloride channel protein [Ramlibacter aquaticus]